jgi:transcriptional regulator with XRE-family HTH domain
MEEIGTKIRIARKKNGLTIKQLAKKVGISPITLQRIETGKSNPSVFLLSEIADAIRRPIYYFFEKGKKPFVQITKKDQRVLSSPSLKIKFIGPRKMMADNIVVTYGELKKGKTIGPHTNRGVEWAYTLEGKGEFTLDGQSSIVETGDSVCYNARLEHVIRALETLKFFSVYLEDRE